MHSLWNEHWVEAILVFTAGLLFGACLVSKQRRLRLGLLATAVTLIALGVTVFVVTINHKLNTFKNTVAYFKQGNLLMLAGDLDGAITEFSKAIESDPRCGEAYCNRGVAFFKKREFQKAIENFKVALSINPDDEHAVVGLAAAEAVIPIQRQTDELNQRKDDAIRELGPFYWIMNGQTASRAGNHDKAIECFSKAIILDQRFAGGAGFYYRALSKLAKGDNDGALLDFNQAIELGTERLQKEPDYKAGREWIAKAYQDRSRLHTKLGRLDQAASDWDKAKDVIDNK